MSRTMEIEFNKANALLALGSLYHNSADALKEYISNALDEWLRAWEQTGTQNPCQVTYRFERDKITIACNSPGMDEAEFEDVLRRVAGSSKRQRGVPQIGYIGIGLWAFNQIGRTATFYSKKSPQSPTIKVILRRESDQAEFALASATESLSSPGMTIVISGLFQDPTKPRGPLALERLKHVFAEQFDPYLRAGLLKLTLSNKEQTVAVEPLQFDMPPIGGTAKEVRLPNSDKSFRYEFWFDPFCSGKLCVRHTGVIVVQDMSSIQAYGLDNTIFTSGYLRGYIDADFLKPLPARALFEENQDWTDFVAALGTIAPELEAEVNKLQEQKEQERRSQVLRKAFRIARAVLNEDQFKDLELPPILEQRASSRKTPASPPAKRDRSKQPETKGTRREPLTPREVMFESGNLRHSRFNGETIEINAAHPDYQAAMENPARRLEYLAMVIGKEAMLYNDKSGESETFLDKLISFIQDVERKAG
ncbi:MAG: ATP-binding protein [Dehalococcoidia bacterium]|nr:ATP-binding protein [Dehalococcoidia bacterium]